MIDDVEFVDQEGDTSISAGTSSSSSSEMGRTGQRPLSACEQLIVTNVNVNVGGGDEVMLMSSPSSTSSSSKAVSPTRPNVFVNGLSSEAREYWATIDFYNASKVRFLNITQN